MKELANCRLVCPLKSLASEIVFNDAQIRQITIVVLQQEDPKPLPEEQLKWAVPLSAH
jgi:hypothetical protein